MKRVSLLLALTLLLITLAGMTNLCLHTAYARDNPTPTPTYDPLAEPFVPENPSEYELGKNWYWHHCMPCHGDKGQGLTDEWRAVWDVDHQNCWTRGCHGGQRDDQGFPIPTVVPSIMNGNKLEQFSSVEDLYIFLKATHPPQHPGYLEDKQYHAISAYVFSVNNRPATKDTPSPTRTAITVSTTTPEKPSPEAPRNPWRAVIGSITALIVLIIVFFGFRKYRQRSKPDE